MKHTDLYQTNPSDYFNQGETTMTTDYETNHLEQGSRLAVRLLSADYLTARAEFNEAMRRKERFVVVETTPGYMPDNEPVEFDSFDDAKAYAQELAGELQEDGYTWESDYLEPDYYSATLTDPRKTFDLGRVIEVLRAEQ